MAEQPTLLQSLAIGALGGITSALSGVTQVPAGTTAARPPITSEQTIFGISQKLVIFGLVALIGALFLLRK